MKKFIIKFKPYTLDDRMELDVVEGNTDIDAKFKWTEENRNTLKICFGYFYEPINSEQVDLFTKNYEEFRKEFYKPKINRNGNK